MSLLLADCRPRALAAVSMVVCLSLAGQAMAGGDGVVSHADMLFPEPEAYVVDPDLSSPTVNEIIIGGSHQPTRDFVVGANFTYRQRSNTSWTAPFVKLDSDPAPRLVTEDDWILPDAPPGQSVLPIGPSGSADF